MRKTFPIYPSYCSDASLTKDQWVKLTATDVQALRLDSEDPVRGVFYHLNHAINRAFVLGIVVEVEVITPRAENVARFTIVSIDDGSGAIVNVRLIHITQTESHLPAELKQKADRDLNLDSHSRLNAEGQIDHGSQRSGTDSESSKVSVEKKRLSLAPKLYETRTKDVRVLAISSQTGIIQGQGMIIDIGTVVKVKGTLHIYKDNVQLDVLTASVVRTVDEELLFWADYTDYWFPILSRPWRLEGAELDDLEDARQAKRLKMNQVKREETAAKWAVQKAKDEKERQLLAREARAEKVIRRETIGIDGNPLDRYTG